MAERSNRRRNKHSSGAMKYVPLTMLLFAVALFIGVAGFFRVSDILVTGADLYSVEEIISASGIKKGDNLLFFSKSEAENAISTAFSYAGDVNVVVKYPSTVEIQPQPSTDIASVSAGGYYWIIDINGKILEQTDLAGAADTISITGLNLVMPEVGNNITDIPEKDEDGNKIETEPHYETQLMYLIDILKVIHAYDAEDKINQLDITSIANISFDYEGRFTVNYGEGGDGGLKFAKMVGIIESQIDETTGGTIEFDAEGGVHFIPN